VLLAGKQHIVNWLSLGLAPCISIGSCHWSTVCLKEAHRINEQFGRLLANQVVVLCIVCFSA
jgi:hypothetical protein